MVHVATYLNEYFVGVKSLDNHLTVQRV